MQPVAPVTGPVEVAPETFLIPNLVPAGDGVYLPVNSLLIRGKEPVVIDTGAPVHREHWLEMVYGLVEPRDIRWIFLSHEDGDHTGALDDVLEAAPNATLVMNFFSTERLGLERPVPIHRQIWREATEYFDAGDRRLRLIMPPVFDGPATRGLLDETSGVMWAVDSFAAGVTDAGYDVHDTPAEVYDETFRAWNSMISPWHQWLDPARYSAHIDSIEALRASVVTSAHGPVLTGGAINDAYERTRRLAGIDRIQPPGQSLLDEMLAELGAA